MKKVLKILGFCTAFFVIGFLLIYITDRQLSSMGSSSDPAAQIRDQIDKDETADPPANVPRVTVERTITEAVPDSVCDRGVILRGPVLDPEADSNTYRARRRSPDRETVWFWTYICDCNLDVESTDQEFRDFCARFSDFGELSYMDLNNMTDYTGLVRIPYRRGANTYYSSFQIFRTSMYTEDYSDGGVWMDAGDGASVKRDLYFDPTGKYILLVNSGPEPDEFMLAFLEPRMISVDITGSAPGAEPLHLTAPEDIERYLDLMHELEFLKLDEESSELAMAENYMVLSFTDENGKINDYKFVGAYMIFRDEVYHIENPDLTDTIM